MRSPHPRVTSEGEEMVLSELVQALWPLIGRRVVARAEAPGGVTLSLLSGVLESASEPFFHTRKRTYMVHLDSGLMSIPLAAVAMIDRSGYVLDDLVVPGLCVMLHGGSAVRIDGEIPVEAIK